MPHPQQPLPSGFSAQSTAAKVIKGIDLTGKTAIVTGGYSGIGVETTRALVDAGAHVVVPARNIEKARQTLAGIDAELEVMDLLDPASIDAFAERFLASGRPLHMLVNSAGVMIPPLTRDARGFEIQFSANHFGHYQLTARLWPALKAAGGARVVSVSSRGHRRAGVDFDDWNYEHKAYDKYQAYGQSKTANALFAVALDTRGEAHGIRALSLHPGAILTPLSRNMTEDDMKPWGLSRNADGSYNAADPSMFKTVEQGAATSVWCATHPQLAGIGGVYCEDCDIAVPATEADLHRGVAAYAVDPEAAERLWAMSERLTGVGLA